jgi:hypothetical protein
MGMARTFEGATSRNAFILSFETPPLEKAVGVAIPDYEPFSMAICCYLSVLYGKRFDNHGPVEASACGQKIKTAGKTRGYPIPA